MKNRMDEISSTIQTEMMPDIMRMADGSVCNNREKWELRRREILDLFQSEVFGYMPQAPEDLLFSRKILLHDMIGGKAYYERIEAAFSTPRGKFSFEFDFYKPYREEAVPAFVYIQFQENVVLSTFPIEKIINEGFAVAVLCCGDIMEDKNDFSQGLAGMYLPEHEKLDGTLNRVYAANEKRGDTHFGAIGAWAFGASRVMDYLQTVPGIDGNHIGVIGHSRLGKAALWTAATDERFRLAVCNASGCSGASLNRFKDENAEHVGQIVNVFPHWFCRNYQKYSGHEGEMKFDQHFLTASLAPRSLYVCSGSEDLWAGPLSEYLCCVASSAPYQLFGLKGFVGPIKEPEGKDIFEDGDIGYSMHAGSHFLGEFEWENAMRFLKRIQREFRQDKEIKDT